MESLRARLFYFVDRRKCLLLRTEHNLPTKSKYQNASMSPVSLTEDHQRSSLYTVVLPHTFVAAVRQIPSSPRVILVSYCSSFVVVMCPVTHCLG